MKQIHEFRQSRAVVYTDIAIPPRLLSKIAKSLNNVLWIGLMAGWRILPRGKAGGAGAVEYGVITGFIATAIIAAALTLGDYLNPAQPFEGEIVAFGEQKIYWDTFGFNVELQQVPCELRLSRAD